MIYSQNKTIKNLRGFKVKTTTKAGGHCNSWETAKKVDIYNNSDPWCQIKGNWIPSFVVKTFDDGIQKCCTDWED